MSYFTLLPCLFLASCQSLYLQKTVNIPQLEKKDDGNVSASFSFNYGFNVQGAYAVTNHLGVMANSFFTYNNDPKYKNDYHRCLELGAGYYTRIGDVAIMEFYGGGSIGLIDAEYSRTFDEFFTNYIIQYFGYIFTQGSYSPIFGPQSGNEDRIRASGKYNTQFLQANLSIPTNDDFYVCLTTKVTRASFTDYKEASITHPGYYVKLGVPSQIMIQPVITLISKGKHLRVMAQLGYVAGIDDARSVFSWQRTIMASGIIYRFNAGKK